MKKKQDKKDGVINKTDMLKKIDTITGTIETYDITSKSNRPIENLVTWFIAIGAGFILTVFSNINNIQINEKIPQKNILIISIVFVGVGLAIISTIRIYLFMREFIIMTARGVLIKIRYKINNDTVVDKDFIKFNRQFKNWLNTIDIPDLIMKLLRNSIIIIILGLLTFTGYFISYLISYH